MALNPEFWRGRNVFVTGHTGFKGSWLLLMLEQLGAKVTGFALPPPTTPSMFMQVSGESRCSHITGDIRDAAALRTAIEKTQPDIVLHLAAQPLVRASYADPIGNYATNVMGTAHLLDACRHAGSIKAIIIITTDKCYENDGRSYGYVENDKLGGYDPYSNSKACAELVTAAYRDSYFAANGVGVASARAGNVIGGGDYADDRLVPDAIRAFNTGKPVEVRNPNAVRPWQHVLEPLYGYLLLAERLYTDHGFAKGWNFGPLASDMAEVQTVIDVLAEKMGSQEIMAVQPGNHPHEAAMLTLDSSLAATELGWVPTLSLNQALEMTAHWYLEAATGHNMAAVTVEQITVFLEMRANA